ncbi:hypothetical protein [Streptomyces sp. NPDC056527]|uniref:hypothetical protein n=1 Tax=Streptomyces sp. NPDC056527 TaxID=3345853 RepID=UPI0036A6065A
MSTAQKRRRKTRTSRVSSRPPIVTSNLKANEIELFPGKEHLICPDCGSWCPITGMQGAPKLVPHHSERASTPNPRRCPGSDRRVVVDVAVGAWRTELAEAVPSTRSRRATRVLPKPKTPQAPAASQIKPAPFSAEKVRQAFRHHQTHCLACKGEVAGLDAQLLPCSDGERLAATFLRLLRQEPKRRTVRDFFARERARLDRRYAAAAPARRMSEWAQVLPAVEAADTRRRQIPVGTSPTESLSVPLEPIRISGWAPKPL